MGIKKTLFLIIIMLLCWNISGCSSFSKENKPEIVRQAEELKGYTRYVGQEEYELCYELVSRDLDDNISEDEKKEKVEEYINRVNAIYYLANTLGLCEPYSFDVIKLRMDQENALRKVKKENGEPVYGLESFTLNTYFQYMLDTVEADLKTYLESCVDNEVIARAREYYEENKESFRYREEVVYTSEVGGKEEKLTADSQMINFMGDADPALADFLMAGDVGQVYEDISGEGSRKVVILEIKESEDGFRDNYDAAILSYIYGHLYSELIDTVAENNPVSFDMAE